MSSSVNFIDNSGKVLAALPGAIDRALWAIGAAAEGHAKDVITDEDRVDTGRMRNSVTHAEQGDATYIGTNVEYAPYNEIGTIHMSGIHFLRKAATEHTQEYKQIALESLKNA